MPADAPEHISKPRKHARESPGRAHAGTGSTADKGIRGHPAGTSSAEPRESDARTATQAAKKRRATYIAGTALPADTPSVQRVASREALAPSSPHKMRVSGPGSTSNTSSGLFAKPSLATFTNSASPPHSRPSALFPAVGTGSKSALASSSATFFRETPSKSRPMVDPGSPFLDMSTLPASKERNIPTWPTPGKLTSSIMSPRQHNDVIMSSPEQKEEKEFWSSPPAKTPRNERHQLLTPVKSGAKQPDDWWLKSPFKTDRGKKFHEKVDFKSPGFGRLTSQFSDFQMMEAGGSAAALSASNSAKHKPTGPSLTGRKSNILFGDFIPAPSSPRGSRPTTPTNELNTLLMFPEASMNSIPLPFELLSLILAYLGPADLMQCVVVSKAWCNATTPNLWKEVRVRSTVGWSKIFGVLKGKPPQAIAGGLGEDFNPLADSPRRSGRAASPGKLSSTSKGIIPFQNHLRHGPRAPVYRSLIKGWAYSSIDADGKRLPMTRGATVQILQSLLTTRAYMPNLRRVSVAGGAEWVDDKFLGMLAAGFGGVLESLTLSGCRNISREALISSMPEFKALSSLRIEYSQAVDREVISRIVAARGSSLESIAIVYCGSLDDEAVKLLSKCREVEITFCPQVTVSGGIRSLVAEAKHLELLRAGHVSWGEPSKPTTLKMPSSLQLVDFSGLPILDDSTEKAPSKLSVTLPTKLKRLLLRDLPRPVRLARVQALIHRCSLLEVLDLSGTSIADITQGELSRALGRSGLQIVSDHEEH